MAGKGEVKPTVFPLTAQPGYDATYTTAYANFASISHTAGEFVLDFCLIAPPHNVNPEEKVLLAPVVSRVVIPAGMGNALVQALTDQIKKQEQSKAKGVLLPVSSKGRHKKK